MRRENPFTFGFFFRYEKKKNEEEGTAEAAEFTGNGKGQRTGGAKPKFQMRERKNTPEREWKLTKAEKSHTPLPKKASSLAFLFPFPLFSPPPLPLPSLSLN
ncbi:hypothetical protein MLD38_005736 [Melastoma candidum]|uniref:Uncharacterized protein n=1 Tax=Melastoma candidum TaxID=119954 RepID=A0ACB9RKK5_9MYRT|nr:hypothetical protein MLD38_005736 [Melastoma candidum]